MIKDDNGNYYYAVVDQGVGNSEWIPTMTKFTILEVNPTPGSSCYIETTSNPLKDLQENKPVIATQWAFGTVASRRKDWMFSDTAFRLVVVNGTATLFARGV